MDCRVESQKKATSAQVESNEIGEKVEKDGRELTLEVVEEADILNLKGGIWGQGR